MATNTTTALASEAATSKAAAALGTELAAREMAVLQAIHENAPGRVEDITSIIGDQAAHVAASSAVAPDLCAYLTRSSDSAVALSAAASNPQQAISDSMLWSRLIAHYRHLRAAIKCPLGAIHGFLAAALGEY